MNDYIGTVIIAPMTTKSHDYPSRITITFMKKTGWIMLDQIRCIDKSRLVKKLGVLEEKDIKKTKEILKECLSIRWGRAPCHRGMAHII